jgi:hypothetical protein
MLHSKADHRDAEPLLLLGSAHCFLLTSALAFVWGRFRLCTGVIRTLELRLDLNASRAVREWLFVPAKQQGTPVDFIAEIAVEFTLPGR